MKYIFFAILLLGSVSAFAKGRYFYAGARFAPYNSGGAIDCARVADILPQISTTELKVKVTENCRLNKHHSKGTRILARSLVAAGTWGFSEVGCAAEHDGIGCGKNVDYLYLETEVTPSHFSKPTEGRDVALPAAECVSVSKLISKMHFTSKSTKIVSRCEDGFLKTTFVPR